MSAKPKQYPDCLCTFRQYMVGDGCHLCSPPEVRYVCPADGCNEGRILEQQEIPGYQKERVVECDLCLGKGWIPRWLWEDMIDPKTPMVIWND